MELNQKYTKKILRWLKPKYWNIFNLVIAAFSKPTILSPINFSGKYSLHLHEYKISKEPNYVENELICYDLLINKQDHKNLSKAWVRGYSRKETKLIILDSRKKQYKKYKVYIKRSNKAMRYRFKLGS